MAEIIEIHNLNEFIKYKNHEDRDYPGCYTTESGLKFLYPINSVNNFFESEVLSQQKDTMVVKTPTDMIFTTFDKGFWFEYCTFLKDIGFYNNCVFNNYFKLEHCIFEQKYDISDSHFNCKYKIFICDCTFKSNVNFKAIKADGEIILENCIFDELVDFSDCQIHSNLVIKSCKFKKGITFENTNFFSDVKIDECYLPKAIFASCNFRGKFKLWCSKVGELNFQNANFYDTTNISYNDEYITDLFNIDFAYSIISGSFFIDSDLGDNKGNPIKLTKSLSFKKALIKSSAFVFLRNINCKHSSLGEIDLSYANIMGVITLQDINIKELNLLKSTIAGRINIEDVCVERYVGRETLTRIKNEFIRQNDIISSLKYKAKEMAEYHSDLKKTKGNKIDKFILWLNSISSDNGLSPKKAIWFTIRVWIGFYICYLIISRLELILCLFLGNKAVEWTIAKDISNMVNYLWSINFLEPLSTWIENLDFSQYLIVRILQIIIASIVFISGKIAIGYGIYQTITSFRKFNK